MKGVPPSNIIENATRWRHFFDSKFDPLPCKESQSGRPLKPNTRAIGS